MDAMKESLRLSVPKPCHKDWENMLPAERGRHCEQCCKTVVDFTGMSDGEVLRFFRERPPGSACGRFAPDQLGRELAPTPVQRNGVKGWPLVVAGAMLLGKGPDGGRPQKAGVQKNCRRTGSRLDEMRLDQVVSGMVISERDSNAARILRDTVIETVTMGAPKMNVANGSDTVVGTISALVGKVGVSDTDWIEPPDTTTIPEAIVTGKSIVKREAVTGELAVVSNAIFCNKIPPDTASRIKLAIDTVMGFLKDTVAAVTLTASGIDEAVKISPNPVMRGGMVRMQWSNAGRYSAAILDLPGQIVQERMFEVGSKGQVDEWAVPNGLAAGVYFLRIARPNGKGVTIELLIQ
jgi:hypothetical protein